MPVVNNAISWNNGLIGHAIPLLTMEERLSLLHLLVDSLDKGDPLFLGSRLNELGST
jgi:hypothetical protein